MARRRYPKFDICKLKPERFRDMTSDQLMKVWARFGASGPAHKKIHQRIKALVVAHAVSKGGGVAKDVREGYRQQGAIIR